MYCPNCGIEIHKEGSFCAKCRKDIAYLTKINEEKKLISDENTENSASFTTETPDAPAAAAKPKEAPTAPQEERLAGKGYFCNYCGTFVYPEDRYCYDCGKKTRPAYYKESSANKNLYIIAAAAMIVLAAIGYMILS